jgi:hypothetical protein
MLHFQQWLLLQHDAAHSAFDQQKLGRVTMMGNSTFSEQHDEEIFIQKYPIG